jgi:hypothetical protein
MIAAIFIVTASFALTESQKIQLPTTRDFSVALRGQRGKPSHRGFVTLSAACLVCQSFHPSILPSVAWDWKVTVEEMSSA